MLLHNVKDTHYINIVPSHEIEGNSCSLCRWSRPGSTGTRRYSQLSSGPDSTLRRSVKNLLLIWDTWQLFNWPLLLLCNKSYFHSNSSRGRVLLMWITFRRFNILLASLDYLSRRFVCSSVWFVWWYIPLYSWITLLALYFDLWFITSVLLKIGWTYPLHPVPKTHGLPVLQVRRPMDFQFYR